MDHLSKHISEIREEYTLATLDENGVGDCPITFFKNWFREAEVAEVTEVNAMTLASVDAGGQPHARTVLLKGLEQDKFVFYTNYNSTKGHDLEANPRVALLFFWKELQRQVRIEGTALKVATHISDEYFASRPKGSQIGAIASPQSAVINGRAHLEELVNAVADKYALSDQLPRPIQWGGFEVEAHKIEFWQGRASRLHDRIVFELSENKIWKKYRIAP